jgi:hypothetical protein
VRLVSTQTGQIVYERTFAGHPPPACPYYTSGDAVYGEPPDESEWMAQIESFITLRGSPTIRRTTVNVGAMNARAEPNTQSDIVAELPYGTPLNLLARNDAGDWLAALTPDMQPVWLYAPLLQLAGDADMDSLPVADGPAADVAITLPRYALQQR